MPEKMKALFRGASNPDGTPAEWLGEEPQSEPGQSATPPVPARHLLPEEYDALTPRNKERVREAKAADGSPLYEVRSEKELASSGAKSSKEGSE